jgi:hypothetical protein
MMIAALLTEGQAFIQNRNFLFKCARWSLERVFHALRGDLRAQVDAGGIGGQRLNLLAQRLVEHGLHAGPAAHAAGFVEADVFELKARGLLGHGC